MIETRQVTASDVAKLLSRREGHYLDMKRKDVKASKLSKAISAFSNSDGGELIVGLGEDAVPGWIWDGYKDEEDANGLIQALEGLYPLSPDLQFTFIEAEGLNGLLLQIQILKSRDIRLAHDRIAYVRRGAQNLPQTTNEQINLLRRIKGIASFEDETTRAPLADVTNSTTVLNFMLEVVPAAEPVMWLRKQQLIDGEHPTVACVVLFSEEPQVYLPKASIKIYRYKSTEREGSRSALAFNPISVEGSLYDQIKLAVEKTVALTEQIPIMGSGGLKNIRYPRDSLHEIITNAALHRDYGLNDDVHVRIFDDRIEVESPGRLPAHITTANILSERFARNPKLVRLINKFPDPPNKDVGEGLNTAFDAMKELGLRSPEIIERENSVLVNIRHEQLASPESLIVDHVRSSGFINNSKAREITGMQSEIRMRRILKKLVESGELEQVPDTFKSTTAYRIPERRKR